MEQFTDEQICKILSLATRRKVLILTVKDRTAVGLKDSITDYIHRHGMGNVLQRFQPKRGRIFFKGAFETVMVMSVDWWNSHAGCDLYVFDGLVYITNRCITDIKHIKEEPRPITEIWDNHSD
ncbi:MAG: hypothetical protein J6C96_03985 [Oscillospiraceae bacterium]|nr:hypothetical protein [Oscillospiraceae bacterium]